MVQQLIIAGYTTGFNLANINICKQMFLNVDEVADIYLNPTGFQKRNLFQ